MQAWLGKFVAVVVAVAGVAMLGAPAIAHPFGAPQSVRVAADGSVVTLTWSAAPDDLLALGGAVGALPERRTVVFDVSPDGDPEPVGQTDADRITGSPAVKDYLSTHLAVYQDGRRCSGEVSVAGLLGAGATATFACPRPVTEVEIEVTMLTDLHEAYRTVAVGAATQPDRALYTRARPVHTWTFDQRGQGENSGVALWLGGATVATCLASAVAAWVLRRVRTR